MHVRSLNSWLVVPLLLSVAAVMDLVSAEAAECSSSSSLPCVHTVARRGLLGLGLSIALDGGAMAGEPEDGLHVVLTPSTVAPTTIPIVVKPTTVPQQKTKTIPKAKLTPALTQTNTAKPKKTSAPATTSASRTMAVPTLAPVAATTGTGDADRDHNDPTPVLPKPKSTTVSVSASAATAATSTISVAKTQRTVASAVPSVSLPTSISASHSSTPSPSPASSPALSPSSPSVSINPSSPSGSLPTAPLVAPGGNSTVIAGPTNSASGTVSVTPTVTVSVTPTVTVPVIPGIVSIFPGTATISASSGTPVPTPTGTLTAPVPSNGTATVTRASTTFRPSPTTAAPKPTTPSTTTTTTNDPPTTTTRTATHPHHTPSRTTTPWLPSTIEPIGPPKTTQTVSPGTSLPDVVIPNLKPVIPANSFNVHLRFEHVSYYQVINNDILAAQLVSFIPAQLGTLLQVDGSSVLVLAIRDASSNASGGSRRARRRALVTTNSGSDAILVTVAIPTSKYWILNSIVQDQKSDLYTPSANSFGQFVDPTFPLSNTPPTNSSSNGATTNPLTGDAFGAGDTNLVTSGANAGAPSSGALIGSLVGVAAAAYVGIAMVVVRRYRSKKLRQQEERDAFQRSISAPIGVQSNIQGWGWHG